ncbi:MAG: Gfo/Idh/MocA family oxidoreductase [Candidatus Latescibacteria bacterium]|jgi:predicted dehydrogenase|nr:Gfo/Idh/MocA family oxidoreductase [Candidatus Latescibacterota bacterium]
MQRKCIHIGVGGRGRWPWQAFPSRDDFEPWLFADINPENLEAAQTACELPDERCFDSMAGAMDSPLADEADTVIVITPPDLHGEMCLDAVKRGKHVIVEKPFTKSLVQAKEIVEEADRQGVKVFVTQNARLGGANWTLARLTRDKVYGRPLFGLIDKAGWRPGVHHSGEDAHAYLWERGIHDLDTLRWVFNDEAKRISCISFNPPWSPYKGGAGAHAWIEFRGGATCAYTCNFCSHTSASVLRVDCERASLEIAGDGIKVVHQGEKEPETVPLDDAPNASHAMLDMFKAYVEDGVEPPSSGPNNLQTVALVEAGGVASDEGRIVDLDDFLAA